MPDTIGRIPVPTVIDSGQTFPLTTQYPFGFSVERPVIVHRFGTLDANRSNGITWASALGCGPSRSRLLIAFIRPLNLFSRFFVRALARHDSSVFYGYSFTLLLFA